MGALAILWLLLKCALIGGIILIMFALAGDGIRRLRVMHYRPPIRSSSGKEVEPL